MAIKPATYQDTFDTVIGSGSLGYDWWQRVETANDDSPEWVVTLTGGDDPDDIKTVAIDHELVMKTARQIIAHHPKYASSALIRECRNLVFSADDVDFDASSADELLQVMVLGEIVYG